MTRGETSTIDLLLPRDVQINRISDRAGVVNDAKLHPARVRQRGFNQAMEIARIASGRLGIPVDQFCIRRCKATAPQSGLTKRERIANIRGAFVLKRPVKAAHVAIIDDVMTTGATAEACTRALRNGGAASVHVLTLARALP